MVIDVVMLTKVIMSVKFFLMYEVVRLLVCQRFCKKNLKNNSKEM